MAHYYHVTAQKPTATIGSCTGYFVKPDIYNLLVVKNTYIEIYEICAEGMKLMKEISFNAKILAAKLFRRKRNKTDSLFILSHDASVCIIDCQFQNNQLELITTASGSIEDRGAKMLENGIEAHIDPDSNYIIIRFYHGILKIIALKNVTDKIIPSDSFEISQSSVNTHTVRIEESNIIDLTFLHGYSLPTFAIIHEEDILLHLRTYEIHGQELILRSIQPSLNSIEPDSNILIPVEKPYGGVIIIGDKLACYQSKEGPHISQYTSQRRSAKILAYAKIDVNRYLLGDISGRLHILTLIPEDGPGSTRSNSKVENLRIDVFGEISIPETLSYLDNSVIFVGSCLGDSQLIRLNIDNENDKKFGLTVLEQFTNIGSIVDMVLFENKGQNQLIACCNANKEGSLRIIRNGIGIHEHATIDQELIKSVWCFSMIDDIYDDVVLVSFLGQSQILKFDTDNLIGVEYPGFSSDQQTIYCAPINSISNSDEITPVSMNLILQVTISSCRLIGSRSRISENLIQQWKPPNGRNISCASSHLDQILVASGSDLYSLKVVVEGNQVKIEQLGYASMPHEVACLDMTPFNIKANNGAILKMKSCQNICSEEINSNNPQILRPFICAVGLWLGHGIHLLSMPDLKPIFHQDLNDQCLSNEKSAKANVEMNVQNQVVALPRSLIISQLEEITYLLVGMGDGTLHYFIIDSRDEKNIKLIDQKKVNAGTGPNMYLRQWKSKTKWNVFVGSNHPCVLHSIKNKIIFANVNLSEVFHMTQLNGSFYTDCICLVTSSGLVIGSVDDLEKLHIRSLPLGETPRRLCIQNSSDTLGVISQRRENFDELDKPQMLRAPISLSSKIPKTSSQLSKSDNVANSEDKILDADVSNILLFNLTTMELKGVHSFYHSQKYCESALSIASMNLEGIAGEVFVVGTAILMIDEYEPSKGRIHIFKWDPSNQRLNPIIVQEVAGAVYRLTELNGKILAAISSSLRIFEVKENSLRHLCAYSDNTMVLYLKCKNDYILIGDLMRSVTVLNYKSQAHNFDVIGKHRYPRWTSAVEILDLDYMFAAEGDGNIYVVTRDGTKREPPLRAIFKKSCISIDSPNHKKSDLMDLENKPGVSSNSLVVDNSVPNSTINRETLPGTSQTNNANIFTSHNESQKPNTLTNESKRLQDSSYMHIGDYVNCTVRGNLVLQHHLGAPEDRWQAIDPNAMMYGTVHGSIGLIVQISPYLFAFLKEVEARLKQIINPVGSFSHDNWRAFKSRKKIRMAQNFIDGDLVESYLDLDYEKKSLVVSGLCVPLSMKEFGVTGIETQKEPSVKDCSVEDLTKIIEEVSRLH